MTREAILETWEDYSRAWTAISPEDRSALMRKVLTEDVIYTFPDSDGRSIDGLAAVIEEFQRQFPGAHFETNQFLEQHSQTLAEWTMRDSRGNPLLKGSSYARFSNQGLIEHLAGFWSR